MRSIANGMPFVDDEKAIGKWKYFDIINTRENFNPVTPVNPLSNKGFKEIYFLPDGEKYWIFEGWTKGYLLVHYGGDEPILCYKYSIKDIACNSYMFIEIKENNNTYIEVLKKVSNNRFKLTEIGRRENVNILFASDDKIVGNWNTVGFVDNIKDFKGNIQPSENFWLRKIIFNPNGEVVRKYSDEDWHDKWSKGVLLDLNKLTVSQYTFKKIDGIEYMFLEWKMGNYVFGDMPPNYYVFVREKETCSDSNKAEA